LNIEETIIDSCKKRIYRKFQPKLINRVFGSEEDIIQFLWLTLLENKESFKKKNPPTIVIALYNKAIDEVRSKIGRLKNKDGNINTKVLNFYNMKYTEEYNLGNDMKGSGLPFLNLIDRLYLSQLVKSTNLNLQEEKLLSLLYKEMIPARKVAKMLGCTESRVSQIKKSIMSKLRNKAITLEEGVLKNA